MQFSGEVTARHLTRAYSATSRSTLLVSVAFGLFIAIALISAFFATLRLPTRYPSWFFPVVVTGFAFFSVSVFLAFVSYLPFVISQKVKRLVKRRPWLLGRVHGTFSAACTTIWHGDLGIQLVSQDLPLHLSRNAYVIRANRRPFALVPTSCFFENDWHSVLDTLELRQSGLVQAIPPPSQSQVCILESLRLNFLGMRLRWYRWVGTTGGATWITAVVVAFYVSQALEETVPGWLVFCSVPVLVFLFYLFRVALWTWHTNRQFANERRGYLSVPEDHPERIVSWFNEEMVFWCSGRMWLHVPKRYLDDVRIGYSVIEFRAGSTEMLFHREGFQSHSSWLAACEAARLLSVELRKAQEHL